MLDDEYYEQKNWIRREVKNSLQAVEELIQTEETKALDGFQSELNLGRAGIILQILAIFFVVWLTASQGINPILHAVDQIKANSPIRETGANEFRYLANAYNNLYAIYRKSIANLNFKASHDELTGAYNRAGYDLLVSSLDMKSTYLMFFDLDNFKVINDTYGHEIGDKVLQKLVQVLKEASAPTTISAVWAATNLWYLWCIPMKCSAISWNGKWSISTRNCRKRKTGYRRFLPA